MSGSTSATYAITGDVWKPRFRVFIDPEGINDPGGEPDIEVATAIKFKVERNNFFHADQFSIEFSLWQDPEKSYDFWVGFDTLGIKIDIAFLGVIDFTEVYRGFADKIVIDCVKGTVIVSGRNALAYFIDSQVHIPNINQTIGDIINELADQVDWPKDHIEFGEGFPLDRDWGRLYQDMRSAGMIGGQSMINAHDLLVQICEAVDANLWFANGIIHFDMGDTGDESFIAIAPQGTFQGGVTKLSPSNCTSLTIEHDLTISQYNHHLYNTVTLNNGKSITSLYPEIAEADASKPDKNHFLESANKSEEDAAKGAESFYNVYRMHEWVITAKVAGPQLINVLPQDKFDLSGTNTFADGWYQIMSIEHSIDVRKGYVGTVIGQWGRDTPTDQAPAPTGG